MNRRTPKTPCGLRHLEEQLFRPLRAVQPTSRADGISLIEAPGMLGEARLVARRIKTLVLRDGVSLGRIVVALRDLSPYADLLHEVFDEYGLPLDLEGTEPLTHNPAVAVLLRALRLPEDDWPFAGVTALLRNTYFRPDWPEAAGLPEIAQHAEALLRLLGEPRGRDAYLNAVQRWAEQQQPGLEDEQAEESRRRRTHELAKLCAALPAALLPRLGRCPRQAPLAEHVAWLRRFAEDMGIGSAAGEEGRERAALARFWEEIDHWLRRERQHWRKPAPRLERRAFHRRLGALAATAGLAADTARAGAGARPVGGAGPAPGRRLRLRDGAGRAQLSAPGRPADAAGRARAAGVQAGRPRPAGRRPGARRNAAVLPARHAGPPRPGAELSRRGRTRPGPAAQLVPDRGARLLRAGGRAGRAAAHADRAATTVTRRCHRRSIASSVARCGPESRTRPAAGRLTANLADAARLMRAPFPRPQRTIPTTACFATRR